MFPLFRSPLYNKFDVQWGLEFRTLEFQIHSKTERFSCSVLGIQMIWNGPSQYWNGPFENQTFQNGHSKLGRCITRFGEHTHLNVDQGSSVQAKAKLQNWA